MTGIIVEIVDTGRLNRQDDLESAKDFSKYLFKIVVPNMIKKGVTYVPDINECSRNTIKNDEMINMIAKKHCVDCLNSVLFKMHYNKSEFVALIGLLDYVFSKNEFIIHDKIKNFNSVQTFTYMLERGKKLLEEFENSIAKVKEKIIYKAITLTDYFNKNAPTTP